MTQSAVCKGNVKWNISVPSEFDEEIRFFLASQGGIKEDLSALVKKPYLVIFWLLSREKPKTKLKIQAFLKKIWTKSLLTVLLGQRTGEMKSLLSPNVLVRYPMLNTIIFR